MPQTAVTRLGINAVFLQQRMGGLETYVRELVPALLDARPELEITLFVTSAGRDAISQEPWIDRVDLVSNRRLSVPMARAFAELTLVGSLVDARGVQVLHNIAMIAPVRVRAANVVTIADVTWLRQPETIPPLTRLLWRTVVPAAARRADRVITLSEVARREIVEDLQVRTEKVDVVHCGPGTSVVAEPSDPGELRQRLKLDGRRVLLAVSALSRHKNLLPVVTALAAIRETRPDVVLVIPGNPTPHGHELEALAHELAVSDALRLPGWVAPPDLEALYRLASCFVFPSLREGFGMPILEAMARGIPVACSSASALPEVAGDAALYFAPDRPPEIASTVARVLNDPALAQELADRGRRRAATFTWGKAALETLEVYERARL